MPKFTKSLLLTLPIFFLLATLTFATATLAVTYIGVVSTTPFYSEWWYTSENPIIQGTAVANATVTIDIDGTTNTTTANESGNWSYTPTLLVSGDHSVTITQGSESVSCTIHIGSTVPADAGSTAPPPSTPATASAELPEAGMGSITVMLLALGFLVTTTGATLLLKPTH